MILINVLLFTCVKMRVSMCLYGMPEAVTKWLSNWHINNDCNHIYMGTAYILVRVVDLLYVLRESSASEVLGKLLAATFGFMYSELGSIIMNSISL